MKTNPTTLVLMALICGCGGGEKKGEVPDPSDRPLPVHAIAYMQEQCDAGDGEACDVIEALQATTALCDSGDEDGCVGRAEILDIMQGLEETLASEKCLDPCSEKCLAVCASVADDEIDSCLDDCMESCLAKGC